MTFERIMVILYTKVAQTVIAERFTHTFFDNDGNRARKIFAYLFSVFIAIFVNLFFYKPIFNFLSILLGLSAIALSYTSEFSGTSLRPVQYGQPLPAERE